MADYKGSAAAGRRQGFWAAALRDDALPFVLALGVLLNLVFAVVRGIWF